MLVTKHAMRSGLHSNHYCPPSLAEAGSRDQTKTKDNTHDKLSTHHENKMEEVTNHERLFSVLGAFGSFFACQGIPEYVHHKAMKLCINS